jgi:predicted nucleotidyltransferase
MEEERLRPPSPPPVVHYTDHEAIAISEKIKQDDTFTKAVLVVITWLERGDCNKRNANNFYSMIQSTNSHVRRLLNEKSQYEEELKKAKEIMKGRMQGILLQFSQIERLFVAACHKKVWDHFTKAQRKNIETWKKLSMVRTTLDHTELVLNSFR